MSDVPVAGVNRKKHTISLYVHNKPGVLNRTALVFARRGLNIDSIVASPGHDPSFTHMNIVATGDERTLGQILKQLNKLVDVVHAVEHTGEGAIERELAMIKLGCPADRRTEVMEIVQTFKGRILDLTEHTLTVQVTGTSEKLDAFERLVNKFGVLEMVRTGKVLITRGEEIT
ncbi:MAG: acetolactate synthase small subunit [Spirochaetales bacterium]|nr:acetolactate synthase small subunit [Spirochaetales bacterium]